LDNLIYKSETLDDLSLIELSVPTQKAAYIEKDAEALDEFQIDTARTNFENTQQSDLSSDDSSSEEEQKR
jgi:hypothetical protein